MNAHCVDSDGSAALNDSTIGRIFGCLTVGASIKDAADVVGIPVSVVRDRRRSDPAFARGLRKAIGQGKVFHLNKISKAAAWQASAWLLERRWRSQFGRKKPDEEKAAVLHESFDWDRLSGEQQRQVIAVLGLAFLPRVETAPQQKSPAAGGGVDERKASASASGADRGIAVPGEPA